MAIEFVKRSIVTCSFYFPMVERVHVCDYITYYFC